MKHRNARIPGRDAFENGQRTVMASVEHIDHAKSVSRRKTGQDGRERFVKDWQALFLIVDG
jgi:hypothetical protein